MTNCAEKQAIEALQVLGLEGEFDGVYGADFMGDVCKPERAAFEAVCARAKIDPNGTVFFEDSVKNLVTAKEMDSHGAGERQDGGGGGRTERGIQARRDDIGRQPEGAREALPGLFIGA